MLFISQTNQATTMTAATSMFATVVLCLVFLDISWAEQSQVEESNFIAADPLYVRLIGSFDPSTDDIYFISALQATFDDYYLTHYDDTLYGFDIAALFIYGATLHEFEAQESTSKITSWCEVQAAFSTPIDLDSTRFNTNIATQFVADFFLDKQSTKLLNRLRKSANITMDAMEAFAGSSDVVKSELQAYISIPSDSSASSSNTTVLKILVGISVTVICLAALALLLSTLLNRYEARKNKDRLGIQKRTTSTRTLSFSRAGANTSIIIDQTSSDNENEVEIHCIDDEELDELHQPKSNIAKKDDPPILSSNSFQIDEGDDDETVVTRNQVSPTASQHNSPTTTNSSSNGSPIWSTFSANSTDCTISPYSTEEVLRKRYRWHDNDTDDDIDVNQLLSLPEEPLSPGTSSHESSIRGAIDEADSADSSTQRDF